MTHGRKPGGLAFRATPPRDDRPMPAFVPAPLPESSGSVGLGIVIVLAATSVLIFGGLHIIGRIFA